MTRSVEIPQAGETAAFEALRAHEDASYWNSQGCHCGATFETTELLHRHIATSIVAAALPYLAPAAKAEPCDHSDYITGDDAKARCGSCGRLMADLTAAPASVGDGGLREALEKLADEYADELGTVSYQWLSEKTLKPLLAAHPAAPAVPQPVDREALVKAAHMYYCVKKDAPTHPFDQEDYDKADEILEILAVLAGEQEQVEP